MDGARPRRSRFDVSDPAAAVLLLVILGVLVSVFFVIGELLGYSARCDRGETCNAVAVGVGRATAQFGPLLVAAGALIATIIRIRAGRRAIWVPLLGIVLAVGVYFAGYTLATAGAERVGALHPPRVSSPLAYGSGDTH